MYYCDSWFRSISSLISVGLFPLDLISDRRIPTSYLVPCNAVVTCVVVGESMGTIWRGVWVRVWLQRTFSRTKANYQGGQAAAVDPPRGDMRYVHFSRDCPARVIVCCSSFSDERCLIFISIFNYCGRCAVSLAPNKLCVARELCLVPRQQSHSVKK